MPDIKDVFGWAKPLPMMGRKCPVTGGRATRMTQDSFRRLCHQRRNNDSAVCALCGGKVVPDGVEFIALPELMSGADNNKESDMGMYGECEMCGEKKKIRSIREKMCCATCEHIWRAANVQPEAMLRAIKEAKGEGWMATQLPMPNPEPVEFSDEPQLSSGDILIDRIITTHQLASGTDIAAFVDNLVAEVEKASRDNTARREELINTKRRLDAVERSLTAAMEDTTTAQRRLHAAEQIVETVRGQVDAAEDESIIEAVQRLQRDRQKAIDIWFETTGILGADVVHCDSLPTIARGMVGELHRLMQQVTAMESISAGEVITGELSEIGGRDAVLLDLALDVLAGKIAGLDAERINALR